MKKIINILLVILWMLLIFHMSSYNGNESSNQSGQIVSFISNILNINDLEALSFIIRKLAHFTEYFILGILTYNMFDSYNKKIYISVILCILYALSDEIHQIFIPGREFKILDILIDSIGAILGIYLYKYILNIINKKQKKIKQN